MKKEYYQNWGNWAYVPSQGDCPPVLCHVGSFYEIDLWTCRTSAEVLDWIFQVAGKSWLTPDDLCDLINAFRVLLNPQARLCSGGWDQGTIDVDAVLLEYELEWIKEGNHES